MTISLGKMRSNLSLKGAPINTEGIIRSNVDYLRKKKRVLA